MMPGMIVAFLFGVGMRCINLLEIFPGGRAYLYDPDCYMRLRKVMVYLAAFPRPLVYDYFQGYPHGTGAISAPIMEYLLAALLLPWTGREIDEHLLTVIMAWIPPLVGGITIAMLYRMVREWFGNVSAAVAALALAVLPLHIDATLLGRFDNEMMEPLLFLLVLAVYLRTFTDDGDKRWIQLGLLQTLFILVWRGALAPLAIIGLDILYRSSRPTAPKEFGRAAARCYLIPALLFALLSMSDIWGTRSIFSYNIVSWFHVVLFTVAGGIVTAARYLTSPSPRERLVSRLVLFGLGLILIPVLKPGVQVAAGGNIWIDSIVEYLPVYRDSSALQFYGLFAVVAPVVAWFTLQQTEREERIIPRRFLMWNICYLFILAFLRRRFGHFYAIEMALAAGLLPILLRNRFRESLRSGVALGGAALVCLLPLQLVTISAFHPLSSQTTGPLKGDLEETFQWMRLRTPVAGNPTRPDRMPAYSVLTHWDLGGYLETLGQRPSVATSYGQETYGLEEAGRMFLSTSSAELASVMDRNRSRYMLLYDPLDKIEMYAQLLGTGRSYFKETWDPVRKQNAYVPRPEALHLAVMRLYVADGSQVPLGQEQLEPVAGVRLVFESASPADLGGFPWTVHRAKLFERVSGARVAVPELPGCLVIGEQRVVTNQGREFVYRTGGEGNRFGRVVVTFPYAPWEGDDSVGSVGEASLTCGSRSVRTKVSRAAISSGTTITLNW